MHIRENDFSDSFLSSDTYLNFAIETSNHLYKFDKNVLFTSLGNNHWHKKISVENNVIDVKVTEVIPNPKQVLSNDENGKPILKLVLGSIDGRQEYFLTYGDHIEIQNLTYNFANNKIEDAVNIYYQNDSLLIECNHTLKQTVMATQVKDMLNFDSGPQSLMLRSLYYDGINDIEFDFRIFMNYILDYDGYRFFQSSFDQDEKGTYLSLNHDFWGT